MEGLKKRLRFGDFDDLILLREVISLNPFGDPNEWVAVQEHVFLITQKKFSIRTLKDHVERLIKLWLEKIKILKDRSGIDEPQTEKDNLCENIHQLMQNFKKEKRIKKLSTSSQANAKKDGQNSRDKWASMMANSQSSQCGENAEISTNVFDHDHSYYEGCEADNVQEEVLLEIEINESEFVENKENCPLSMNLEAHKSKFISPKPVCHGNEETPGPSLGPITPEKKAKVSMPSTPATPARTPAKISKILAPVKTRTRKINAQRQGLAYLEKYDSLQMELKRKELDLEERKIAFEQEKFNLEKEEKAKKAILEERKLALQEYEIKKKLELEEKKINLEMEDKKMLKSLIERQEKIINMLLSKQ